MGRMTLRLHPVDVLMFRETRYFAEATADSLSEFPLPKTIAGAMRTLMMRAAEVDFKAIRCAMSDARREAKTDARYMCSLKKHLREACTNACGGTWPVDAEIRGPFLSRCGIRWYPLPRSIVKVKGEDDSPVALRPALGEVPGWDGEAGRRPLFAGNGDATESWGDAFLREDDLAEFLQGNTPNAETIEEGLREEFIADERRVGISVDPEAGSAAEGLIYSSTFMRLEKDCALEVDLQFDGDPPVRLAEFIKCRSWLRLGGESRAARVEEVDAQTPPDVPDAEGQPLLYLATPAVFDNERWYPGDLQPLAAAVGSPKVFSGWDLAANLPMKTRYAVPAGAVFFYSTEDADSLPEHGSCISDNDDDRAAGWGYCFKGVWS